MDKAKHLFLIVLAGIVSLGGCAVTPDGDKTSVQLAMLHQDLRLVNERLVMLEKGKIDSAPACIWEGKRYTSGAVVNDQVCMVETNQEGKKAVWWNGSLESVRALRDANVRR